MILVLAVTGLMLLGVLAGSSAQVHEQEYRDSVQSLQSEMQSQYTEVQNPTVDRTRAASAQTCGIVTPVSRGTSANCFVVGRLISSDGNGVVNETPVLGHSPGTGSSTPLNNTANSHTTANGWTLYIDSGAQSTYKVEWGSQLKATSSGIGSTDKFNILLIMSPSDGSIRTYANRQGAIADPTQLYGLLAGTQQTLNLCVVAGAGVIFGDPLAVQIPADAGGAAGISVPSQSDGVCHGL